MTPGSFLLGLAYYSVAVLCLAAFKSKKKSADARRGVRAYLEAMRSFLRALVERRTRLPELARAAAPWFALASFLVVLGLVRQFNLQVLITEAIQSEAWVEGWYAERRERQLQWIAAVAVAGVVALLALSILLRKRLADVGLAVIGAVLLVVLLAVRGVSHHRVDELLMEPLFATVAPAYLMELLGLIAVASAAILSVRRARAGTRVISRPIVARIDSVDPP